MSQDKTIANIGPWGILSSSKIYENPWIELTDHKVLTPAGQTGQYGVVGFKNRAVGIVPYEDGYVWLVGQTRFPLGRYCWEIPEGGCPPDEDLLDCAHRELKEETGLTSKSLQPQLNSKAFMKRSSAERSQTLSQSLPVTN